MDGRHRVAVDTPEFLIGENTTSHRRGVFEDVTDRKLPSRKCDSHELQL
jgi:hypothetical protein